MVLILQFLIQLTKVELEGFKVGSSSSRTQESQRQEAGYKLKVSLVYTSNSRPPALLGNVLPQRDVNSIYLLFIRPQQQTNQSITLPEFTEFTHRAWVKGLLDHGNPKQPHWKVFRQCTCWHFQSQVGRVPLQLAFPSVFTPHLLRSHAIRTDLHTNGQEAQLDSPGRLQDPPSKLTSENLFQAVTANLMKMAAVLLGR